MAVTTQEQEVLDALRVVQDPDLHRDIVSLGFVQNLKIEGGAVSFDVNLTTPACPVKDQLKNQARMAVARLPWVTDVNVTMTARTVAARGQGGSTTPLIPRVKNVIAVASGKGGVGKSTTSVNLAMALSHTGAKVGLLDADIYGPNVPLMMGLKEKPEVTGTEGHINPVLRFGIKLMSIGFFLDERKPVIWRGPMVHGAIQQFLRDVDWGELDYLVIDLPPGTGDAQLTLSQRIPISGAVIVTTPQEVALADAVKGLKMFQEVKTSILGIVENMSGFVCPGCGERHDIFGTGGGARTAAQHEVPLLGEIPIEPAVREGGDTGRPVVVAAPDSAPAQAFRHLAARVATRLGVDAARKPRKAMIRLMPTR
jgi:ATP-binding protein involved in chromosome partitioning